MRVAGRLYVLLVLALCLLAALALLRGEWALAATAAGLVLASLGGPVWVVVILAVSLVLGVYPASALGAALLTTLLYGRRRNLPFLGRLADARFDPAALAATTSAGVVLPASAIADGPLTTRTILAAAAASRPQVWGPLLGSDPGPDAFDGPLLTDADGNLCSQYAAEAIGVATVLAERTGRPLDLDLVAPCAALVPVSAASAWIPGELGLEAIQFLDLEVLAEAAAAFAGTPAGADMMRRVEAVSSLDAVEARSLDREQLAALDSGTLRTVARIGALATAYAWVAVAGELLVDLGRWLLGLPRRALSLPGRARRLFSARERGALGRRWDRISEPWASWPPPLRWIWVLVRPLLGLGGLVCIFVFGAAALWVELLAALAVALALRAVRVPVVLLLVAAWVATIAPPAAALLAARIVISEGVLWGLGGRHGPRRARSAGLAAVAAARGRAAERVLGDPTLELSAAREALAAAIDGYDEDEVLEAAFPYGVAAWAHWRWLELVRLAWAVGRGVLFNRWTDPTGDEGFDRRMLPLVVLEGIVSALVRGAVVALVAVLAFLFVPVGGGVLGLAGFWGHCAAAFATLLMALPLTMRRPFFPGAVAAALFALFLVGSNAWGAVALAVAAAFAVPALRRLWEAFSVRGRGRWQRWPAPPRTPPRLRLHWRAASRAIESGRARLGIAMFEDLARDAGDRGVLFAAALGRAALVEVELGRLQAAADHLDEISAREGKLEGTAAVATGMLAAALGDHQRAVRELREAKDGLDPSSPLAQRATLALCEAQVHAGEADAAIELIRAQRAQPFAIRGIAALLEVQVAIATAMLERGEAGQAEQMVEEIDHWEEDDFGSLLGAEGRRRMWRVTAQGLLLRGRLLLVSRPGDAVPILERAFAAAGRVEDESLRAGAEVLLGSALTRTGRAESGLEMIGKGVDLLEERRVQLRAPDRRTAMIVAGGSFYGAALQGALAAQRGRVAGAGLLAARLIESLRQNALATTLRSGPLPLDPATKRAAEAVLAGEREDGDVDELRALVGAEISERFAEAYLPESVSAGQIWAAARRFGHVLSFYVPPDGLPGWRVWVSPEGEAEVDPVGGPGSGELLSALAESGALPDAHLHTPLCVGAKAWERFGEDLIPVGLRERLSNTSRERPEKILVVPAGPLALVPWAALRVGGRPLVERAIVQTAPLLDLVGGEGSVTPAERVVAHLFADVGSAELARMRATSDVRVVETRERFLAALDSELFDGAYMASHGYDLGLRQRVEFSDGSPLSAAGALACSWPPWVVFSSCLVGRVEHTIGQEPFGLAISCMLRGADSVVASVVELTDSGAIVCGELAADLANGSNPAQALRAAQMGMLRDRSLATLADGLGLTCISTLRSR